MFMVGRFRPPSPARGEGLCRPCLLWLCVAVGGRYHLMSRHLQYPQLIQRDGRGEAALVPAGSGIAMGFDGLWGDRGELRIGFGFGLDLFEGDQGAAGLGERGLSGAAFEEVVHLGEQGIDFGLADQVQQGAEGEAEFSGDGAEGEVLAFPEVEEGFDEVV